MCKKLTFTIVACIQNTIVVHLSAFLSHGFTMHRLKGTDALVLNRWIKPGESNLPPG
jgi:hypothetical protein